MVCPRDPVLEITARAGTDVALPHIGPGTASIIRFARRLACGAGRVGGHVQIAVVSAESIDGIFQRPLAWLDHAGAADTGNAAFILDARRHLAFQPASRGRVGGARIGETPGAATCVAFAARGTDRRVPVADLEAHIVAADAVKSALALRLTGKREHGECERGP